MENVYGALILHALGKDISEDAIEKIVKAAGASADKGQIKTLVSALGEMKIDDVLAGATMMTAAPAAAPAAASGAPAKEAKKEEKKKEEKKEDDEPVGLDALFG
nr:50S ribosomal protein P1 [Candidatus Sigynarchaeota archaeon]